MWKITGITLSLVALLVAGCTNSPQKFSTYNAENDALTIRDLRPLAEKGDAESQFQLGVLYVQGRGVAQDYNEAAHWTALAAEQGHAHAQLNLGWMYEGGRGVPMNIREAARYYRLAAEQGRAHAQLKLAQMYFEGLGDVPRDDLYAYMWSNMSAALGVNEGAALRDRVARTMTDEAIQQAQDLSLECVEKEYKGC